MPNIKITYDTDSDGRITKDEKDTLKREFVAKAKEVVKTDPDLYFHDGPTQSPVGPDDVVVDNSTSAEGAPAPAEESGSNETGGSNSTRNRKPDHS